MRGHDVEHLVPIALAATGLDAMPQHHLLAIVMECRREAEATAQPRVLDRPAGEGASHFGDVFLRVAAVHAERVKFEQFTAVVLVQSTRTLARRLRAGLLRA